MENEKIVISERAYVAIMAETLGEINTETGGVFLGHCKNGIWYVIETIAPGPKSIFSPVTFEYDHEYLNYLINKINILYKEPLKLIGLWHRHPGSMDTFSSTDDKTNKKFAKINSYGAISILINVDPKFRITAYTVSPQQPMYKTIKHILGNKFIPEELLTYTPAKELENKINNTFMKKIHCMNT